ncbi:MAG: hypothetical protein KF856_09740 [Cyclobacteriaceae bacterium]|nr:hypothetical protein [Cyclobacteriaceae bacterium]
MRLGQLARKLSVRPSQLVDMLAKHQQFLEDGSNAKLSDDLVKQIVLYFAPERLTEIMIVQTQETEPEPQQPEVVIPPVVVQPQAEVTTETKSEVENSETIRAPKVELAGLKVLGKIELPTPRKKEEAKVEGETTEAEQKPKREQKDKRRKPIERTEKPWRNPIALQREKEEREKEERRKQLLEEQKERKRLNYLNKIKNNAPIKAARIYDEPVEVEATKATTQQPRTWLGRFLRWLNT